MTHLPKHRHVAAVMIFLGISFLSGCAQPSATFTRAVELTADAVEPEHMAYVEADTRLTEEEKGIRRRTWQLLRQAILEAKAAQVTP